MAIDPVVCTLTTKALATRSLEWADVVPLAQSVTLIDGGAAAVFGLEHAAAIADLADREADCCGTWLHASVTTDAGAVHLRITTENPDGVELIRSMLAG